MIATVLSNPILQRAARAGLRALVSLLLAFLPLPAALAHAQTVPPSLNFQGRLATPDGTPVADAASQSLTFRLYSASSGRTPLWSQSSLVPVHNGVFAARLDFSTGFTAGQTLASAFNGSAIYLETQVGSDAPLTPRQPLASNAYAFLANSALSVPDGSVTLSKLAGGVLNFNHISGQIVGSQIAAGTITNANLSGSLQSTLNLLSLNPVPFPVGSAATNDSPFFVAVSGGMAYVVGFSDTLQIFDVSSSANPVLTGSATTGSQPVAVAVSGSTAYVVNSSGNTLQIFDVSNPNSPVLKGSVATGNGPAAVAVSGSIAYVVSVNANVLQTFNVSDALQVSGNLLVTGGGSFGGIVTANGVTLTSDARYKANVQALDNPLDDILNLRGVTYDFDRAKWPAKNFPNGRQIGFLAQEVEAVFPELVSTDASGYKSVNYIGVVPVLVEAMKRQQKQMQAQKWQIESQQRRLEELERQNARIGELEAKLAALVSARR